MSTNSHFPDLTAFLGFCISLFSELLKHLGANDTGYGVLMGITIGVSGIYLKWRQVKAVEYQSQGQYRHNRASDKEGI